MVYDRAFFLIITIIIISGWTKMMAGESERKKGRFADESLFSISKK